MRLYFRIAQQGGAAYAKLRFVEGNRCDAIIVTPMIQSVTVYCSSSMHLASPMYDAGAALGTAIARKGWQLVYGGNRVGLMGVIADAARAAGGRVVGITPQVFIDMGVADNDCDEFIVADDMRHRKQLLERRGDALLAMPGGLGTFEELFEVICGKSLGYHAKPIVILNIERYFDPLLEMIEHGIAHGFIRPRARALYFVSNSVQQAMDDLQRHEPEVGPTHQPFTSASE